jgi:tetratricopeptide (TPR) repeat protein
VGLVPAARGASATNAPLDDASIVRMVTRIAQSSHVCCLALGVGFWPEVFYLQPRGLLQEMKVNQDTLSDPPLTAAELADNQAFWQRAIESDVRPLLRLVSQPELPRPEFQQWLMKAWHLQTPPPAQARVLAGWYSGALNRWGVTLQRNGRWTEATPCFALASDLNPENLPALVNLQCNSNLLAHQKLTLVRSRVLSEQVRDYRNFGQIVTRNGPFDEPSYCYQLGQGFASAGMMRQACQQLERIKALVPGDISVRLTLGDMFNVWLRPDDALTTVAEIKADPNLRPLGATNEVELALLEARAWFARTNLPVAQAIVHALLATHPRDAFVLERAGATLTAFRSYADALRITDQLLQLTPNDPVTLANKGNLCVLTGDYSNAIPLLTLSLSLTNTYAGRLLRAIAYTRTGRLDAAEADYRELLQTFPAGHRAYNGLAEIALQKRDTNAAIRYYEQYLSKAEPDTEEARSTAARLKSLQQGH